MNALADAAVDDAPVAASEDAWTATLDLAALAGIARGEQVRIQGLANRTQDLFERTVALVDDARAGTAAGAACVGGDGRRRFMPQEADLRARFKFAEALGSYATLNSLLDRYAPAYRLTQALAAQTLVAALTPREVTELEQYREQIDAALRHAAEHLAECSLANFSSAELNELTAILGEARHRFELLDALLGRRLIHDVEEAVKRLHGFHEKIQTVQRTLSGIFLVDSEIMFLPARDLVKAVEDIFKAIGNPFVVEHIDGTLLLAARNLLIQVISFYSYYGREQIYQVLGTHQGKAGRAQVAACIRAEIRMLFSVCKASNKLVLTRVMDTAEREFELSVEAIQVEAANRAIVAMERLMPAKVVLPPPPRGFIARLSRWLFRASA